MAILLFIILLVVAYANGANDNMKGVATLVGSRTLSYKRALTLTTVVTLLGSLAALLISTGLLEAFSGKGIVPSTLAGQSSFLFGVATGTAFTVLLATQIGFPISTTHALIGGLIGSAFALSPHAISWSVLSLKFFAPLLLSPLLAIALSAVLNRICRRRRSLFATAKLCLCRVEMVLAGGPMGIGKLMTVIIAPLKQCSCLCESGFAKKIASFAPEDIAHIFSASLVSFARGLNDTPKIAALLLASSAILSPATALLLVSMFIAIGGILQARKVAETMSFELTSMTHHQGFLANIVTGFLVIFASGMGMPVSTTHVSVGSIVGLGAATHQAKWKRITEVLLSWALTLPIAAIIAYSISSLLS